jgi:membrane-associated PAP2 superfamily phosphatase
MTDSPIPTFVVAICFASGILLLALAIPLWLRRVPPNILYGVRFRSTLANDDAWYEVNARGGRNLVVIAIGYLLLLSVSLRIGTWQPGLRLLAPTVVLIFALILNTILLRNAANGILAAKEFDKSLKPPS